MEMLRAGSGVLRGSWARWRAALSLSRVTPVAFEESGADEERSGSFMANVLRSQGAKFESAWSVGQPPLWQIRLPIQAIERSHGMAPEVSRNQ